MRSFRPGVTPVVWLITAAMATWQVLDPAVLQTLRRDPAFVDRGEWWRALSPLLVQADGWPQIVTNLVFLAVIGYFAELRFGPVRWLVLYLAGGVAGELAGYAWEPHGGGNSVAIFGLAGGLLAAGLVGPATVSPCAVAAATVFTASVFGLAIGGGVGSVVASALVVVYCTQVAPRVGDRTGHYRVAFAVSAAMAVLLVPLHDDHGPAVLTGLIVGLVLVLVERKPIDDARPGNQLRHGVHTRRDQHP